ncbi:MAG: aminopeptidase [Candidatus Angelobacter sp.]|nr:aminopeptidase [Candidatus Angelobacter sp.]
MRKRSFASVLLLLIVAISAATATERQPNADYRARRVALSEKTNGGTVILFAPTEAEGPNDLFGFRQEDNFYYLTGSKEPGLALLISPAQPANANSPARPYTEILFLPGHNLSQEKWTGPKLGPESPDAKERTGFYRIAKLDTMRDELVRILPQPRAIVYTDQGKSSASAGSLEWLSRANAFPNYVGFADVNPLLASLRVKKDAGEIALIRKATDASVAAHFAALRTVKPGVTEREISALMQYEFGKRGCERPAYAPIVGSGFYSTVLHYSEDENTIKNGDLVVMDVAGEYSMYASDITRTVPANGHFTARQREIYNIVLGAHDAAIKAFKAGASTLSRSGSNSLYQVAMDYINSHGKDLHGEPLGKYFIHGVGHYVGLNVHDAGDVNAPLQPGAVFTIEPGIYIPEENLGVRIEDDFWVNDRGELINLSGALPSTADEIEKAMATNPK